MKIVTQKEFAELAGVSPPAVSKAIKAGKIPVTDRRRIDVEDEKCVEYLASKGVNLSAQEPEQKPNRKISVGRSAMFSKRDRQDDDDDDAGSFAPSRRDLEMKKLAADAQFRELKNAQMEGRLVARDVMIQGVWNPIETFLVRILSDGAKTIAATVHPLVLSDGTKEEVEVAIRQELTSFIVPLKEAIQKALKINLNV